MMLKCVNIPPLQGMVFGKGYDCRQDKKTVYKLDKGRGETTDGMWNRVSSFVPWIREKAADMGEELDTCGAS